MYNLLIKEKVPLQALIETLWDLFLFNIYWIMVLPVIDSLEHGNVS